MSRAFGIITKLDLCPTRAKFSEHQRKTINELTQRGFSSDKVYPVCAHVSLLEEIGTDLEQLNKTKERIREFEGLSEGFDNCKQALNRFIEHDLPYSRLRQVTSLTKQKIVRYVHEALELGSRLMPTNTDQTAMNDYIKQIKSEQWENIFNNERYGPTLNRAARWQKESLVLNRVNACIN